jgi:hypothetical protein
MKRQHRLNPRVIAAGTSMVALAAILSGCGGSSAPPSSAVTVTVTPTVTAGSGSKPSSAAPKTATSDDVGRAFDYGKVVKTTSVAGVTVLVLDRYTWKGLDDAALAKQGLTVRPFKKGQVPYENLNTTLTYRIPVADGARILYQHCVAFDQPLQTKSIAPTDLTGLHAPEDTVVVSLDGQGRATVVENVPGCS